MFSCPRAPPIRFSKRAKGGECESSSRISDIKSAEAGVKTEEAGPQSEKLHRKDLNWRWSISKLGKVSDDGPSGRMYRGVACSRFGRKISRLVGRRLQSAERQKELVAERRGVEYQEPPGLLAPLRLRDMPGDTTVRLLCPGLFIRRSETARAQDTRPAAPRRKVVAGGAQQSGRGDTRAVTSPSV